MLHIVAPKSSVPFFLHHHRQARPKSCPTFTSTPSNTTAVIDRDWSYQPSTSDPDDDALTYALVNGPAGMQVDATTGLVSWRVVGNNDDSVAVTLEVSDGIVSTQQSFELTLTDTPPDAIAPILSIDNLPPGTVLQQPTDIVISVADENLDHWQLSLLRNGHAEEHREMIASGNAEVSAEAVYTFDPTQRRNGLYTLTFDAIDAYGNASQLTRAFEVDGQMKVGNFTVAFEDLSIPMLGVPIQVTRTYDSRRRSEALDFGYGWSVDYQNVDVQESRTPGTDWSLVTTAGPLGVPRYCVEANDNLRVSVTLPDDSLERFAIVASPRCNNASPILDVSLAFEATDDTTSSLVALDDTFGRLDSENGLLGEIASNVALNPSRYQLTTQAGYIYTLNQQFGIESVEDPNGNTLTYTSTGIVHSLSLIHI